MVFLSGCIFEIPKRFMVFPSEQKAMLEHLEEKYGETFIIESTSTPGWNENSVTRGAYVYPEGKEYDRFFVEITRKGGFVDQYALREPEKRMQSFYQEWIQSIIPSAKAAVRLRMSYGGIKEVTYNPSETLQQFVSEVDHLYIDVNIMLSETMLGNKDEIFEKLSKALEIEPITGYESGVYTIGFFVYDVFNNLKSGEYNHITTNVNSEMESLKEVVKNLVAASNCYTASGGKATTQREILEQLNKNFERRKNYDRIE